MKSLNWCLALPVALVVSVGVLLVGPARVQAEDSDAAPLVDLLRDLRAESEREEAANRKREAEFLRARDRQKSMLEASMAAEERALARAAELEQLFEENEKALGELEDTLSERMGSLGELFGVVRQTASDARSRLEESLISSQLSGRGEFLAKLGESTDLPPMDDLEKLWLLVHEEMTEQGRVVAYEAEVIAPEGGKSVRRVVRVGPFNAVSGGLYLQYLPESEALAELVRQPSARFLETVGALESAESGMAPFALDPSRGALLSMLVQAPKLEERLHQGGPVGYTILGLGALGLLYALFRMLVLSVVGRKIRRQTSQEEADTRNPLGRILQAYHDNRNGSTEALELHLDEVILRETSRLQRGVTLVKVLSVVAPLLGLLGTVTGMILTFQQITLFGTGDPKLMAGGISQALVTTVLGLVAAIPLTLVHSVIVERTKILTSILQEQSVGLVAEHAESHPSEATAA